MYDSVCSNFYGHWLDNLLKGNNMKNIKYFVALWIVASGTFANLAIKIQIEECGYINSEEAAEIIKDSLYFPFIIIPVIGNEIKESSKCGDEK